MPMPSSSRLAAARVAGPSAVPSRLAATVRRAGPSALWPRLGAATGIVGPVAFTGAWIVASLRQTGHSAVAVQLSGLAAPDARDPGIMIAGFVALGACTVAFGGSLHRALGGSGPSASPRRAWLGARVDGPRLRRVRLEPRRSDFGPPRAGLGPRLIQCAGALTIAAGLLRRDHMMLGSPGAAVGESWHNHAHDLVSSIIYVTLVVAPLLLAVRFRGDARWQRLWVPLLAGSAATAGLLGLAAVGSGPAAGRGDHPAGHGGRRRRSAVDRGAGRDWPAHDTAGPGYGSQVRTGRQVSATRMPDSPMTVPAPTPWKARDLLIGWWVITTRNPRDVPGSA
jgi:hypothetical protein